MGDPGVGADPSEGSRQLLVRPFDAATVTALRGELSRCAASHGLAGDPLDDFVLAVNEVITNAVRHGGGAGLLRLWHTPGRLVCEVSDRGAGIAGDTADRRDRPSPRVAGGWGLWLARQLSDGMVVSSGTDGTRVRISADTPSAE